MNKVCMIYTGGTIGMKKEAQGYVPCKGFLAEQLALMPECSYPEVPAFDLIEYEPLLDSSNIHCEHWIKIAEDIFRLYDRYSGFVILHGTDTMAYTASALSFMLKGLSKPVVLTGSQIPFGVIRSDARDNIISSLMIAGENKVPEVCVFFGNHLFRGNRSIKVSSDEKGAFASPNYPDLAESGVHIRYFDKNIAPAGNELLYTPIHPQKIAVLKTIPGISYDIFHSIVDSGLDALVIEGFGAGNIPNIGGELDSLLSKAQKAGTPIVICTQCIRGSTSVGEYETSSQLKGFGAICAFDMTTEAAVAKLYYLLSKGYAGEKLKLMMETNLAGELTKAK